MYPDCADPVPRREPRVVRECACARATPVAARVVAADARNSDRCVHGDRVGAKLALASANVGKRRPVLLCSRARAVFAGAKPRTAEERKGEEKEEM